jgi:hypothetical protein
MAEGDFGMTAWMAGTSPAMTAGGDAGKTAPVTMADAKLPQSLNNFLDKLVHTYSLCSQALQQETPLSLPSERRSCTETAPAQA